MAERVAPRIDGNSYQHDDDHDQEDEHHPIAEYSPDESRQTYVVQIPKDQIYRVPPPENAIFVQQLQRPAKEKKKPMCAKCCLWFFISVILIFLLLGLVALLITVFLKPKAPEIHIDQFVAMNSSRNNMEYDVKLKITNVNSLTSIEYGESGAASLSFNKKDVAKGPIPKLDLSNNGNSLIKLALGGSTNNVPKEMAKSMKSKKPKVRVSLLLKLHMPSRTKIWTMKFGSMTYDVSCNFVVDTLTKGSRILSQACVTQVV